MTIPQKQLSRAIFEGKYPIVALSPFKKGVLKDFEIKAELRPWDEPLLEQGFLLTSSLVSFLSEVLDAPKSSLCLLPVGVLSSIAQAHLKESSQWVRQVAEALPEFIASRESWVKWSVVSSGGMNKIFPGSLTPLQQVWISANKGEEKKADVDIWVEITKSLWPWLNPQAYEAVQNKENARENVGYARDSAAIREGIDLDELNDDDLDILR